MIASRIICLVLGYAFGLFQTGYLYGKTQHIDIREHGSGNAGATNTLRTLGAKAGLIVFLGDAGKTMLSMLAAWLLFRQEYGDGVRLLAMYAGLGSVLGHNFPFYMGFKGGKGVACTAGFLLAFYPPMAPVCLLVFLLVVALTKYVSLGSILVGACFFAQLILYGQLGYLGVRTGLLPEVYVLGAAFTLLILGRHHANIMRLLKGTENKFSMHKSGDPAKKQ